MFASIAFAAALSSADMAEFKRVNHDINTIDRRSAPLAPQAERDGVYDCEDYAWGKYNALRGYGVSPDRMKLYAVTTASQERHMILVVDGLVFDNLEPRLEPESKAKAWYKGRWDDRTDDPNRIYINLEP